VAALDHWRR
jgi:hypothetical protein